MADIGRTIRDLGKPLWTREFTRPRPPLRSEFFDPREGIGQVPDNTQIDYMGFVKPLTFREWDNLVPRIDQQLAGPGSTPGILSELKRGRKLGNPFLSTIWDEDDRLWRIRGHEGRHRMLALRQLLEGETRDGSTFPVHVFPPSYMRRRHLTPEMLDAPFISQDGFTQYKARGGLAMHRECSCGG